MKKNTYYLLAICLICVLASCKNLKTDDKQAQVSVLKETFKNKFHIGVALNKQEFMGFNTKASEAIATHFNSIVAENCMKSMFLQPKEGEFFFNDADKFIGFGEKNNMHIIGHTLIWHSQAPGWFFRDKEGNDVSAEVLTQRMKNHIHTVVGRYKGRVKGWDVVNEAIEDNGEWRKSKFYQIIGKDFIKLAFQFAHEADPDAELYYNDYSMALDGRRATVVQMVKSLQEQGIRIDGIGMQGHVDMYGPSINDFEKSILAYAGLGMKVMVTELDLSVLPSPWENVGANISDAIDYQEQMNPYPAGLTENMEQQWEARYMDFFKLFLKHHDKIDRVTLWGLSDATSWKNDFPIKDRVDYPLLFDRDYNPKPIVSKFSALTNSELTALKTN
ncbi:endo-1,4-beta-xylanase [Bacteroides sp. 51]|uniref:endo-1,4-beta-xylanase n=1 Tax=Bacteroides sp. 51 TaxID=2302938 RepID=UPI0013D31715|nr:endo-1,4-beta-xylanase [Bacteroides sp. 51]NDV80884.1 endo-1,4-beta-xylanase [Bacteroides sp. 51]